MNEMEGERQDDWEADNATPIDNTAPTENTAPVKVEPPRGMRRTDADGQPLIDALAGRASVFGFGFEPITEAIQTVAENYLGDASGLELQESVDGPLPELLLELLDQSTNVMPDSILLFPSPDEAVDRAIGLTRSRSSDTAFRTIAFVGSDHGRTGMCRTASGRPELSSGFGPMMAGFTHVPIGDLDAVRNSIDDQTCCVLLSPVDFSDSARPVDANFLTGLRELCDQRDVWLVVDETRITFGASGKPFSFASIADITADMVIVSAGLFGGLPGGLIIAGEKATGGNVIDTLRYPLQSAVAAATLSAMIQQNLPGSMVNAMHEFAVELAESLSEFEFVRDVHASGMTLGVEADIESNELVQAARSKGLRIEAAGETAFCLQLPLLINDDDHQQLLDTLKQAMESVQRETANLVV